MPQTTNRIARIWREGLAPESLQAYAFAAAGLGAATLVRYALDWINGDVLPFVSYFPAIVLTTLVADLGPGLFVAVASTVVRWWTSVPAGGTDWVNVGFYLVCCVLTVWIVHFYRN